MRLFSPENRSRYSEAGSPTPKEGWVVHYVKKIILSYCLLLLRYLGLKLFFELLCYTYDIQLL